MTSYSDARSGQSTSGGPGAAGAGAFSSSASALTRKHRMAVDEACQILNIRPVDFQAGPQDANVSAELDKMLKAYETMYKANEGTSKYLLSKVVRARDRIEAEMQANPAAGSSHA